MCLEDKRRTRRTFGPVWWVALCGRLRNQAVETIQPSGFTRRVSPHDCEDCWKVSSDYIDRYNSIRGRLLERARQRVLRAMAKRTIELLGG